VSLLQEYAPARPVRLLGVRVAGLSSPADAREQASDPATQAQARAPRDQLALPV
jgi:hypothetical protein